MCCDICPKYEECEKENQLKDKCCPDCPEYEYCIGGETKEGNKNHSNVEGIEDIEEEPGDNQDF